VSVVDHEVVVAAVAREDDPLLVEVDFVVALVAVSVEDSVVDAVVHHPVDVVVHIVAARHDLVHLRVDDRDRLVVPPHEVVPRRLNALRPPPLLRKRQRLQQAPPLLVLRLANHHPLPQLLVDHGHLLKKRLTLRNALVVDQLHNVHYDIFELLDIDRSNKP